MYIYQERAAAVAAVTVVTAAAAEVQKIAKEHKCRNGIKIAFDR